MKYIDADRLKTEIEKNTPDGLQLLVYRDIILSLIDFLQQEQQDFPTTDEQVKEILATHPKVEVPNKYKTPDWLWNKQEQPEVDLVAELKHHLDTTPKEQLEKEWKELEPWCNVGPTVQEFLYGKQPEVDLEKIIEQTYHDGSVADTSDMDHVDYENIARHFYELGLKARKV